MGSMKPKNAITEQEKEVLDQLTQAAASLGIEPEQLGVIKGRIIRDGEWERLVSLKEEYFNRGELLCVYITNNRTGNYKTIVLWQDNSFLCPKCNRPPKVKMAYEESAKSLTGRCHCGRRWFIFKNNQISWLYSLFVGI